MTLQKNGWLLFSTNFTEKSQLVLALTQEDASSVEILFYNQRKDLRFILKVLLWIFWIALRFRDDHAFM